MNQKSSVTQTLKSVRKVLTSDKLDGNNGLLLSPHVDHLFDQGYISFSDDGAMIVSPAIQQETLERWSIDPGRNCGAFRAEQRPYLAFHREFIFKS